MSPITRETLASRIATLEADSNISIKEQFYLKTMRLLLAEMDKAPHHNGMMQLSNELANAKAALSRLSTYARTYAGDIQYTGDHPIAVAEKLAGQSFGNAEQLDTAPTQFESLAGEPVSERYTLNDPVVPEGWQLVPKEPTWEMLSADGCKKHHADQECAHHDNRRRIWAAMLSNAPGVKS